MLAEKALGNHFISLHYLRFEIMFRMFYGSLDNSMYVHE